MKPNGKTINFATKPVCPECGGEIPTNEIAVEEDSAHCPTCGRVMSFAEVSDYSLVMAKRKESLPPGFSVTSDSGSSLTLSFKSARIGLRLFGVVFAILFAIPIPWAIYNLLAGHCRSYSFGIGFVVVIVLLETWMLFCIQNEWKLHMVFLFSPGHCSYIVQPTFFKPRAREYSFSRDTTFGLMRGSVILFSPSRPPEVMTLPFPMTGEQMFYLYSCLIDFKYGISAGAFKIGEPNPVQKPPMQIPPWKGIAWRAWFILVSVIMAIRIGLAILEWLK